MGRHAGDRQQTSRHGPSAALADLFLLGAASSDLTEPGLREGDKSGSSRGDTVLPATGACRRGQGMSFFSALEVRPAWAVTRGKINMAVLTLCALKTLQLIRN